MACVNRGCLQSMTKCHICGRDFYHTGDLILHFITTHGGMTIYKCPFCDFATLTWKGIIMHAHRKHFHVKTCPVCGKRVRPNNIVSHATKAWMYSRDVEHLRLLVTLNAKNNHIPSDLKTLIRKTMQFKILVSPST